MHRMLEGKKIDALIETSKRAGNSIMDVYSTDFDYEIKHDNSPLTIADKISNEIICKDLRKITPGIPILSEENAHIPFIERSLWKTYWLVDPLDGTKEFINRNGDFTVNIALIEDNIARFGLIHAPNFNTTYWGLIGGKAYRQLNNHKPEIIKVSELGEKIRIVSSRSHPSDKTNMFIKKISNHQIVKTGSSLKFCLIASGEADLYPRFGPTCEWDIAAGHAILESAGGKLLNKDRSIKRYNLSDSLINDDFIAFGDAKIGSFINPIIEKDNRELNFS